MLAKLFRHEKKGEILVLVPIMNVTERDEALQTVPDRLNPIAGNTLEKLQKELIGERISRVEYGVTWGSNGIWLHIITLTGKIIQVALDFDEEDFGGFNFHKPRS